LTETGFDVGRFARHSLMVGVLTRYLFARRQKIEPFESLWSADEMFAAGVLHDIGLPLLARVAPDDYMRVLMLSRRKKSLIREAFSLIFDCELPELGAEVATRWELPSVFIDTMRYSEAPWRRPDEMVALACLSYADTLAGAFGYDYEPWEVTREPLPEAEMEVGVPPQELTALKPLVERLVNELLEPGESGLAA
jgi:hypothetical protein